MFSTMPKTIAAALTAVILTAAAPAWSAETATFNDTARFLAGLPPSPDSPLAPLTKDPAWQQHARYFDTIFAREENVHLSKVRAFSKEFLTDKHETMLYMFSGPDFLYATSFFPNASTYVLAGLEPSGDIPQLTNLSRGTVNRALRNLEVSMSSLLSVSFFITNKMRTQLHEGPVYGTLPGAHGIHGADRKDHSRRQRGGARSRRQFHQARRTGSRRRQESGARLRPQRRARRQDRLLGWQRAKADPLLLQHQPLGRLGRAQRLMAFVDKLPPADAFIKSASYLLHSGSFSKVRGMILDHSATVLEDDSGIPLAYFDAKKWKLQPFGRYVGPFSIFGHAYQPGMAQLYQRATPLSFGIGYRFRTNESNLLLAQRSATQTSEQELTPSSPPPQDEAQAPKKTKKTSQSRRTGRVRLSLRRHFPVLFRRVLEGQPLIPVKMGT